MPSDPKRRKRIKRGQRVAFKLTRQERDLIVERTFVDAEIEGRLRSASSSGSDLIADLTLDDVTTSPATWLRRKYFRCHGSQRGIFTRPMSSPIG